MARQPYFGRIKKSEQTEKKTSYFHDLAYGIIGYCECLVKVLADHSICSLKKELVKWPLAS